MKHLDGVQSGYIHDLGLSEQEAFLDYNLVPLRLRRCIGVLGLLHKCPLGLEHDSLAQFFPHAHDVRLLSVTTRSVFRRHSRQLRDFCGADAPDYLCRSILGMSYVYNHLPQVVVDLPSVSSFQAALSQMGRNSYGTANYSSELLFCHVNVRKSSTPNLLKLYASLV